MEQNVVLEMRGISKNFTGVRALSHVDFTLRKGEIHALMGENGAGKSTLIKVLTGVHEFESGSIHMNGENKDIINHSPQEAQANGISTVYQEVNLCPNLTVAENLFIGREPRNKVGMINWKEMNARSAKLLESLNINVPPTQMLDECSVAIQQMIAIARAVDMKCKVLILDEPTSSLDDEEVEKLFVLMRRLREEGVGIIFVTHFLEQVYAVCDRITVLRNGELVGEYETKDLPRVMLVAKMMGKDFDDLADIKGDHKDKKVFSETPVIEAEGIGHKGTIRPFDLKINKGEVIGLTGLLGSGRSELVRSIYGADKADSGTLKVNGKEVKINSPLDAMKLGMAYLPEDRKAEGIIADLSVRENIIIAMQAKKGMFPGDNQIRVTSSARANLFLILDGVDGVDHGSPETLALQLPHTDDGRTAGRTDDILHHGGMLPRGELQLSRTDDHLAGHAVGIGTHDAVLDGSVGQRLDEHRHEGRAATADRPRNAELGGIHRHHEPHMRQQRLHRLPLGFGQRMAAFADDDTLADCHGRIGNRAEVMRPGREDLLVAVERHPGGYRNDDLARQHPFDGGQHSFDLVRFHRHDHHVGEPRDSCGIVESEEPVGFRITVQLRPVAGACADLPGLQSPRCGKPCGQGLRHVSESDKSYLHIIIVWNNPSPRISATRHAPSSSRTRRRWGSRATCPSTGC